MGGGVRFAKHDCLDLNHYTSVNVVGVFDHGRALEVTTTVRTITGIRNVPDERLHASFLSRGVNARDPSAAEGHALDLFWGFLLQSPSRAIAHDRKGDLRPQTNIAHTMKSMHSWI